MDVDRQMLTGGKQDSMHVVLVFGRDHGNKCTYFQVWDFLSLSNVHQLGTLSYLLTPSSFLCGWSHQWLFGQLTELTWLSQLWVVCCDEGEQNVQIIHGVRHSRGDIRILAFLVHHAFVGFVLGPF